MGGEHRGKEDRQLSGEAGPGGEDHVGSEPGRLPTDLSLEADGAAQ